MAEVDVAESVIDRLLLALAAQLATSPVPGPSAGAVEALADLSRAEAERIFGQAGHLVHYGADTEPLEALLHAITGILRVEAPAEVPVKPGDEVRLVGEVPESLTDYDEAWLRRITFTVRYTGRNAMVDVQSDLMEDYVIVTVPAAAVERIQPA
ncbi:hypothetical protein ACTI_65530 [Actinoplanes sp. OR16]|uniref:hypothetical protein n=1 Tax=Actinoplanes sp. OR16 TaxID=946334 RepID=UPI000F6CB4A3|nr:hypothetical protein [Actinoplanes sp. OR16]BBH69868.1 hypothetical protein ACTI_65530 [Actinoplanes sp. OR16]